MTLDLEVVEKVAKSHPMFKCSTHPTLPLKLFSYRFADPTVFSDPVARELRGIVFDDRGNLVARPFHKFFNLGEQLCEVSEDETAVSTLKIDGSLAIAFEYRGDLVFASKGSFKSFVVEGAYRLADDRIRDLVHEFRGKTVLFEYVDPNHPVVLTYPKPELRLIGIRDNASGEYIPATEIVEIAESYELPHTTIVHSDTTVGEIAKEVRGWQGEEGVVAYAESDLCKIKSQWYLRTHSVASWIVAENMSVVEKRVKKMYINNEIDDIYPHLPETHREIVDRIIRKANKEIEDFTKTVKAVLAKVSEMSRKNAAIRMKELGVDKAVMAVVFRVMSGISVEQAVYESFKKRWR